MNRVNSRQASRPAPVSLWFHVSERGVLGTRSSLQIQDSESECDIFSPGPRSRPRVICLTRSHLQISSDTVRGQLEVGS